MTDKLYLRKACIDFNPFDKLNRLAIIPYMEEELNTLDKELWVELAIGDSPLYILFRNISYCNHQAIYEAVSYRSDRPEGKVYSASTLGE